MIASCGFVAVGVWKMGMPTNSFDISWFEATIDFVENRLENSLRLQGPVKVLFNLKYESAKNEFMFYCFKTFNRLQP
jgi:hypothetical protein